MRKHWSIEAEWILLGHRSKREIQQWEWKGACKPDGKQKTVPIGLKPKPKSLPDLFPSFLNRPNEQGYKKSFIWNVEAFGFQSGNKLGCWWRRNKNLQNMKELFSGKSWRRRWSNSRNKTYCAPKLNSSAFVFETSLAKTFFCLSRLFVLTFSVPLERKLNTDPF